MPAISVLLLLALLAPTAGAAPALRLACADGAACDADRTADGACTFALCRVPCGQPACRAAYAPCLDPPADTVRVLVPLGRGERPRRRVTRVGRTRVVLRCQPPGDAGAPPLASGCRTEMDAAACAAHGGDYEAAGLLPTPSCRCRMDDAGTPCRHAGDCQGLCLAPLDDPADARCSVHLIEFGCWVVRDAEGVSRRLCID
jgi:hypothetical protein